MYSNQAKVLHSIGGKPMLEHVVDTAFSIEQVELSIVIGFEAQQIQNYFADKQYPKPLNWAVQEQQLGTGHAVQQALNTLDKIEESECVILVLYGDVPLIESSTLAKLIAQADAEALALLTFIAEDPTGLGRIIRDDESNICAIVEEKDANEAQKQIKEVNSGIMAVPAAKLAQWLNAVSNDNAQGEYYLTDIIALAHKQSCSINGITIRDELEVQGVNDKKQLAVLERHYQMKRVEALLEAGVTIRDPARVDVRGELLCGRDVEVDVNTIFEGKVTLGNNVRVGANVVIKDSSVGDNVSILPGTNIDGAKIEEGVILGPYARIRPGTVLRKNVKIGNFVETKNAIIGEGSKANHLAYIGDAELGTNVNIGAGTIVCNYDGANKHKTLIGNNVFVGSNSVLIAPVELADNTFIAAGSAINCDVPEGNLAVGRAKQKNIAGWKRPEKEET